MSVDLFPHHSTHIAKPKTRDSRENARRDDNSEEIPQTAHERPARELIGQEAPRQRCRTNEPGEETDVRGEVLDGRAAEMVKLGENSRPPERAQKLNLAPFRHLACSMKDVFINEDLMYGIRSAARGGAAALMFLAATACSQNSNLGDILGGVLGGSGSGSGSQVSGSVAGVNTRLQQVGIQQSNGQTVTLNYDNNTQVVYQNKNYSVSSLEYGDQVTARVQNANNSNSGYYTDLIQVNQSVTTDGGSSGNVQQFEGTVRSVDRTNGVFQIASNNYGTLIVSLPYNLRTADLNTFNNLRNGDYVRIYGTMLNNSRVELRQFY